MAKKTVHQATAHKVPAKPPAQSDVSKIPAIMGKG